jgi:hypothetical protein
MNLTYKDVKGGYLPSEQEFERWLTTGDAANKLGKSRQGVVWLLENRRLRGVRTALGWLVDPRDVTRLEREQEDDIWAANRKGDDDE